MSRNISLSYYFITAQLLLAKRLVNLVLEFGEIVIVSLVHEQGSVYSFETGWAVTEQYSN